MALLLTSGNRASCSFPSFQDVFESLTPSGLTLLAIFWAFNLHVVKDAT